MQIDSLSDFFKNYVKSISYLRNQLLSDDFLKIEKERFFGGESGRPEGEFGMRVREFLRIKFFGCTERCPGCNRVCELEKSHFKRWKIPHSCDFFGHGIWRICDQNHSLKKDNNSIINESENTLKRVKTINKKMTKDTRIKIKKVVFPFALCEGFGFNPPEIIGPNYSEEDNQKDKQRSKSFQPGPDWDPQPKPTIQTQSLQNNQLSFWERYGNIFCHFNNFNLFRDHPENVVHFVACLDSNSVSMENTIGEQFVFRLSTDFSTVVNNILNINCISGCSVSLMDVVEVGRKSVFYTSLPSMLKINPEVDNPQTIHHNIASGKFSCREILHNNDYRFQNLFDFQLIVDFIERNLEKTTYDSQIFVFVLGNKDFINYELLSRHKMDDFLKEIDFQVVFIFHTLTHKFRSALREYFGGKVSFKQLNVYQSETMMTVQSAVVEMAPYSEIRN